MGYEEFKRALLEELQGFYGKDAVVGLRRMREKNGQGYDGLWIVLAEGGGCTGLVLNVPTIGLLEFLKVSAAFDFEYDSFLDIACHSIFQTGNDFIYPNVDTALFNCCHVITPYIVIFMGLLFFLYYKSKEETCTKS